MGQLELPLLTVHYCISISFRFTHSLERARSTGPAPHQAKVSSISSISSALTFLPFFLPSLVTAASDVCCTNRCLTAVNGVAVASNLHTFERILFAAHLNRCSLSHYIHSHIFGLFCFALSFFALLACANGRLPASCSPDRQTVTIAAESVPFSDLCNFLNFFYTDRF